MLSIIVFQNLQCGLETLRTSLFCLGFLIQVFLTFLLHSGIFPVCLIHPGRTPLPPDFKEAPLAPREAITHAYLGQLGMLSLSGPHGNPRSITKSSVLLQ